MPDPLDSTPGPSYVGHVTFIDANDRGYNRAQLGPTLAITWVCRRCGCLVEYHDTHDAWHDEHDNRSKP